MSPELPDELSEGFPPQRQEPPGVTEAMRPVPDHGERSYRGSGRLSGMRGDTTAGQAPGVRPGHSAGPGRTAGRGRTRVRLPRFAV